MAFEEHGTFELFQVDKQEQCAWRSRARPSTSTPTSILCPECFVGASAQLNSSLNGSVSYQHSMALSQTSNGARLVCCCAMGASELARTLSAPHEQASKGSCCIRTSRSPSSSSSSSRPPIYTSQEDKLIAAYRHQPKAKQQPWQPYPQQQP
jgi:hypothetical protein